MWGAISRGVWGEGLANLNVIRVNARWGNGIPRSFADKTPSRIASSKFGLKSGFFITRKALISRAGGRGFPSRRSERKGLDPYRERPDPRRTLNQMMDQGPVMIIRGEETTKTFHLYIADEVRKNTAAQIFDLAHARGFVCARMKRPIHASSG